MKNIKNLLVATVALLSAATMADMGLLPPVVPANDSAPVRINLGLQGGMNGMHNGTESKFGLTSVGGGIGFTHLVGYDFEYGASVSVGYASLLNMARIWTDEGKPNSGLRVEADLMARYMPEMAEHLRAGFVLGLGYGDLFTGEKTKAFKEGRDFGDLYVKPGIALSYAFTNAVAGSIGVSYSLHNIRFGQKDGDVKENHTNENGLDIPASLWFGLADSAGLFIQANSRFTNFKRFAKSFREEVSLGVSYAL